MDNIAIYQIDAFTDKIFHGNPAAVCLLPHWLNEELMQAIAQENNLSETAYIIETDSGFHIRWFTPKGEISLCGHATLAAGFLLFELEKVAEDASIEFASLGGLLTVKKNGDLYSLDFPRLHYHQIHSTETYNSLIDQPFLNAYESELDYLLVLANEEMVAQAQVDLKAVVLMNKRGLILTAQSQEADFYSRCFYPKHNIPEDPVTGSAHCVLAPFWADQLKKSQLKGIQGSIRKGEIFCQVFDKRVVMSGNCKWYMKGQLVI